jgi:Asp-tRNA(Asn)/Glu-tRNA(Gln) amidotransferase A subunit family amidase
MSFAEYVEYDGVGLAALVERNEVTPLELVDAAISRAEALNPSLNAIVYRTLERAGEHAKDERLRDSPFKGVPFLLKDTLARTTDAPTRAGSGFVPNQPALYDAELTARFRRAGLISLGKTNVPEFLATLDNYVPTTPLQKATGQPAINLPLHWSAAGLPIGIQFVGRFGDEATLLSLAAELERARPWDRHRPNL